MFSLRFFFSWTFYWKEFFLTASACPACATPAMRVFHEQNAVPVHSCLLLSTQDEAQEFPTGDIRLGFCEKCGFISNLAFDQANNAYSTRYEETQAFSPVFREFARDVCAHYLEKYELAGKKVFEIGCGKGEFLVLFCEMGGCDGVGIDPGYRPERTERTTTSRISFIQDLYSKEHAHLTGDFVVCRHTLEHIWPVEEFLGVLRDSLGLDSRKLVYFELPDTLRVLEEVAFWDIYYEHCSYFTPGSLSRLFRRTGLVPIDLWLAYDDQYIMIDARPCATAQESGTDEREKIAGLLRLEDDLEKTRLAVEHFTEQHPRHLRDWQDLIAEATSNGGKVVCWGSGSKGVSFLTSLGIREEIRYVVDINPYKHGMFMAGTGQEIVPPTFLRDYRPETVIVMNPVYEKEIGDSLRALGVEARLVTV